ncbi:FkbM family methyltransferase [Variovorax sp. R-27]|uniref:FkbM family methyltransferase n=1 Tax=Variovorax sp. R-27 TaxID=3404058 RepID=UPI003CE84B44
MPVRIGDRTFQVTSDDEYLGNLNGTFEPATVELFHTLVRPNDVALDIGANIGCTALLLSQLASKTICFEPSPSTYALLQSNVENAGAANVVLVNAGLGAEAADLSIVFSPTNRSGGFVSDKPLEGHAMESIKIVHGDEYLKAALPGTKVDFVKIDVEGYELHVLDGLAETLVRDRPVVTLELNHWCLNAFQRMSVPDFFDGLRAKFPVLYALGKRGARDLHSPANSYFVMHEHIVKFDYPVIVGAFHESQLEVFLDRYVRNPPAYEEPVPAEVRIVELQAALSQTEQVLAAELVTRAREQAVAFTLARDAEARQRDAEERRQQLQATIDALHASHSWKVTAPLRAMRDLLN